MSTAPTLKAQDVLVACRLVVAGGDAPARKFAEALHLSLGAVHASLKRLRQARLVSSQDSGSEIARDKFLDFLVHAVPTVFFPRKTELVRGLPTGASAPFFREKLEPSPDARVLVWPYARGKVVGEGLVPIYPSVPAACSEDGRLYNLVAAVEILRVGRKKEREVAISYVEEVLELARGCEREEENLEAAEVGAPLDLASEADTKVEGTKRGVVRS